MTSNKFKIDNISYFYLKLEYLIATQPSVCLKYESSPLCLNHQEIKGGVIKITSV